MLVFAVEYVARIWTAPEHPLLRSSTPAGARLRFAATPLMLIDALALLPLLLELLFPSEALLPLTRLVRFLKLARYSPALATLGRLIAAERRSLLACVIIFTGVLLAAAAAMHAVEGTLQPDKLGDMPKAIWWAASMLAKIGGGEITPVTTLGSIIAAITVMLGIGCFALPVAIIGRGFYEEIRRRDFVVTFAMVARVPLFAHLDAASIADLVAMLRARTVPAGTIIIHKGERGNAMYLIASGGVDVESAPARCAWRRAISSARWRCSPASRARRPSRRCAPPICWCSTPTTSRASSTGCRTSASASGPWPRGASRSAPPAVAGLARSLQDHAALDARGTPRMDPMAKGWTVQVTTHDRGMRCDRVRQQLFDVAIEDKDKAVEAVRHQLRTLADAQVEATAELHSGAYLSPGRVRCRGRASVASRPEAIYG